MTMQYYTYQHLDDSNDVAPCQSKRVDDAAVQNNIQNDINIMNAYTAAIQRGGTPTEILNNVAKWED